MEEKWEKSQQGLSRRTFLQVAAAGAVGAAAVGALSACSPSGGGSTGGGTSGGGTAAPSGPSKELIKGLPAIEQVKVEETLECDVLVIGGGASGCCTALRAAEEGAKVILVEKMSVLGGCYNLSWATCTVNSKYAPDDP
ncbi:MAG: FAD-dependent oxidoreductase, partial [Coriobacteriaceae bacterium]|nr:FAD-dependent oxidoreductase [Coriobacteriaceae bacterium]